MAFSKPTLVVLYFLGSFSCLANAASISSTPAQTFDAIGGSGAWWPYDLFNFPETVRQNVSDLLFSQSGLGLSSYRWNIGGGGVGLSSPSRAPETFWVSPGQYNFSRDQAGQYFLKAASDRGVSQLTGFVNSAPPALTSSNQSCNGIFVSGKEAAFGTYLADVVAHIRDQGINLSLVSPMNEPDNNFGPSPCGQEGMVVTPFQRAAVISGVYDALSSRGLLNDVGILADESSWILETVEYPFWLPSVKDKIHALVHHTYDFPSDAAYLSYVTATSLAYPGINTWMSEVCCSLGNADGSGRGWSQGYDPTIKNALMFSTLMLQSFVVAGEPHYDFWTLVSNSIGCSPLDNSTCATTPNSNGWTDGLIYYDADYETNGNHELYLTKHFWTFKHFGNFVRPGSKRLPITGSDANNLMMALADSSGAYVAMVINPADAVSQLELAFPTSVNPSKGYRTSEAEDFATLNASGSINGSDTAWTVQLEPMSLTTWFFA